MIILPVFHVCEGQKRTSDLLEVELQLVALTMKAQLSVRIVDALNH